ncbi:MAG: transglycosylase SLT domain-containing protein [Anaerolineae bacterium]|nr:transglycosylase SLT domain-containing protein [Anaerolineae bacterium]
MTDQNDEKSSRPARRKVTPLENDAAEEPASKPAPAKAPRKSKTEAAAKRTNKPTSKAKAGAKKPAKPLSDRLLRVARLVQILVRFAPIWLLICILLVVFGPVIIRSIRRPTAIAPLFTKEVQYWAGNIARWSVEYDVNPNLIATLMQIESCGYPGAASSVGAQGLFQVMPFHFSEAENMTDPETNARRGIGVIKDCLERSEGDVGLAMACYNGGPRLIFTAPSQWPAESQRYYTWGGGIYNDAIKGASRSATLDSWLDAGGIGLCRQAAAALSLPTMQPISSPVNPTITPTPVPVLPTLPIDQPPTAIQPTISAPGMLPTFALEPDSSAPQR